MTLRIHGFLQSTCTRLVLLICKEHDIPYEFIPVNLKEGQHKKPGFVANQPFGQVPFIDDDGFILFESRAIARYLIKKYPKEGLALIPTDPQAEARFEQAASIEAFNFNPYASGVAREKIFKPRYGFETDEAFVKVYLEGLNEKLQVYDGILGKQRYLAGDEVTLADLQHLPYGTLLTVGTADFAPEPFAESKRPNVARWWKDISSRPAWKAVLGE